MSTAFFMSLVDDSFLDHTDAVCFEQFLEVFDLSNQLASLVGVFYHDALGTEFHNLQLTDVER